MNDSTKSLVDAGAEANGSADKYAFAAWAESPFNSNNRAR